MTYSVIVGIYIRYILQEYFGDCDWNIDQKAKTPMFRTLWLDILLQTDILLPTLFSCSSIILFFCMQNCLCSNFLAYFQIQTMLPSRQSLLLTSVTIHVCVKNCSELAYGFRLCLFVQHVFPTSHSFISKPSCVIDGGFASWGNSKIIITQNIVFRS